jgi:hypothetical protein
MPAWRFMDTYVIELPSPKRKLKDKALSVLLLGGMYFVLYFSFTLLWPSAAESHRGLLSNATEAGLAALAWGIWMAAFPANPRSAYKLLVNEDSITSEMEYGRWMNWLAPRWTVRKGEVRTIFDVKGRAGKPGGFGVSSRSRLGARMLGFIYVPNTLPDYEYLRRLAESWRSKEQID